MAENLPLLSINFVLACEQEVWALRYPDAHELYVLERAAGQGVQHDSSLGTRVAAAQGERAPTVTLASERMDDDPAWRLLEPGELLHVTPQLEVQSHRIIDAPPAHPLTLSDLSGKARASQREVPR